MESSDPLLERRLAARPALPGTQRVGLEGQATETSANIAKSRLQNRGKRLPSNVADGVLRRPRVLHASNPNVQLCRGMPATAMMQTVDQIPIANGRGSAFFAAVCASDEFDAGRLPYRRLDLADRRTPPPLNRPSIR
jgi:hypothetical protein